jgi:putative cell wall-binding protein
MKINNNEIYALANATLSELSNLNIYIPAKANFFLQKNLQTLAAAAQEIEKSRLEIAKHYGVLDESGQQYKIPEDKLEEASKELNDLFSIEQELDIKTFSIEALGNAEFTLAQMQAIMFMIED